MSTDTLAEAVEEAVEETGSDMDTLAETTGELGISADALAVAEGLGRETETDVLPAEAPDWRSSSRWGPPHFSYWGLPAQGVLQLFHGTSVWDAPFSNVFPQ